MLHEFLQLFCMNLSNLYRLISLHLRVERPIFHFRTKLFSFQILAYRFHWKIIVFQLHFYIKFNIYNKWVVDFICVANALKISLNSQSVGAHFISFLCFQLAVVLSWHCRIDYFHTFWLFLLQSFYFQIYLLFHF